MNGVGRLVKIAEFGDFDEGTKILKS